MKIFFNRKPVTGPWGGGTKILSAVLEECKKRNHEVTFDLNEKSDLIFCLDPRPNQEHDFFMLYNKKIKEGIKIVQRVGDLGTHGKPELFDLVKKSSEFSDCVIFPSKWARDYSRVKNSNQVVVLNAPLKQFIKSNDNLLDRESIKLVTHHWSDNSMKGFDTYDFLNRFCESHQEYSFTFIGRKPNSCLIKNYVQPQDVEQLIQTIPKNDIYVTSSKKEAGANHVLEALALGLPVLYHEDGGSIVEYCQDYGISYKDNDELVEIIQNKNLLEKIVKDKKTYVRSSEDMAKDYVDIFEGL